MLVIVELNRRSMCVHVSIFPSSLVSAGIEGHSPPQNSMGYHLTFLRTMTFAFVIHDLPPAQSLTIPDPGDRAVLPKWVWGCRFRGLKPNVHLEIGDCSIIVSWYS
jgi:hypothetical protein